MQATSGIVGDKYLQTKADSLIKEIKIAWLNYTAMCNCVPLGGLGGGWCGRGSTMILNFDYEALCGRGCSDTVMLKSVWDLTCRLEISE